MIKSQNRRMVIVTILAIGLVFVCIGSIYSNIVRTRYTNSLVDVSQRGIVITSIKANELVKLPITIEGYLDGQGWTAKDGKVGIVEVFDANGKSIGGPDILTTSDSTTYPVHFKMLVVDRQWICCIQTKTGTVKITSNSVMSDGQLTSISIPVRFFGHFNFLLRKTNNSSSTSNWKTFTDTEYGFSFKYPSNLYVNKSSYGDGWWFITQESIAPVFEFEDSCGTSKAYINVIGMKDITTSGMRQNADERIAVVEYNFNNTGGEKFYDKTVDDVRTAKFRGRMYDGEIYSRHEMHFKGKSYVDISYKHCAGGTIPFDEIASTLKFI